MISYIIYFISILTLAVSLVILGKKFDNLTLPFVNEKNVYIYIFASMIIIYLSSSYLSWVRDVDTICREREKRI